jgi:cytochrome c oxidase subunit IV
MACERLVLAYALLVLTDLVYVLLARLVCLGCSHLLITATCVFYMLLGMSLRWGGVG